jgi:TolB protein
MAQRGSLHRLYIQFLRLSAGTTLLLTGPLALAQTPEAIGNSSKSTPNEDVLGEFVVTGTMQEHFPKIAILPNSDPAYEDVIVRTVVRKDLDLSGMFRLIPDSEAPAGAYGFTDPVDVTAWQRLGAEAVVKVAAREFEGDKKKIEVIGLAYFPSVGKAPVYETKLVVDKTNARKTAHQITDDLLGALTGRPGGFSSRFAFSGPWGRNLRVFTVDSDGHGLTPQTDEKSTSISPTFGDHGHLVYSESKNYMPFRLHVKRVDGEETAALNLDFQGSIYSSSFDADKKRLAVAVAEEGKSAIFVGETNGSKMKRVSTTELATHPAFSSEGHLAWVGGSVENRSQRVYVDGKAVSPSGFTASAPTFCDTEDGVFLIYAVAVGGERQDLILSRPNGQGVTRLTQNQGSNSYPACSPDGRLLAFFSTRGGDEGLYVLSLKRWTTQKIRGGMGESLRWEALSREDLTETKAKTDKNAAPLVKPNLGPACGLAPGPS